MYMCVFKQINTDRKKSKTETSGGTHRVRGREAHSHCEELTGWESEACTRMCMPWLPNSSEKEKQNGMIPKSDVSSVSTDRQVVQRRTSLHKGALAKT